MKKSLCVSLPALLVALLLILTLGCGGQTRDGADAPPAGADDDADDDSSDDDSGDDDDDDDNDDNDDDNNDNDDDDDNNDNDNDNDDELPFCEFVDCQTPANLDAVAWTMLQQEGTYCGGLTPDNAFADVLKINDLLASRPSRPLWYHVNYTEVQPQYTGYELVFSDGLLSAFRALLFVPNDGRPTHPAVLMTHGHGSYAEAMWAMGAEALVERGVVVLIQEMKELSIGAPAKTGGLLGYPDQASFRYLAVDRSAYGVMLYQTTLLLDFLAQRPEVDATRLGTWGHSGGSFLSYNAAALDARVKVVSDDYNAEFPDPEQGYLPEQSLEEVIPQFFCWGGGSRVHALAEHATRIVSPYGYPGDVLAQAADTVAAELTSEPVCGDEVCGPGEAAANCAADCESDASPAIPAEHAEPVAYDELDIEATVANLTLRYVYHLAANGLPPPAQRIAQLTSLATVKHLLGCLPNSVATTNGTFQGYTETTEELCFGDVGPVGADEYFPHEPADSLIVVMIRAFNSYAPGFDEGEVISRLLEGGAYVLDIHLPYTEPLDYDAARQQIRLVGYGAAMPGFYLWQAQDALEAFRRTLGVAVPRVVLYGNSGGAYLSLLLALLFPDVEAIATGLNWPLWEPDTPFETVQFNAADYFTNQAALGTRDQLLAALADRRMLIFDRLTGNPQEIADFLLTP
jgi:dienelactone hydrolase